jgi:hypothetical protein
VAPHAERLGERAPVSQPAGDGVGRIRVAGRRGDVHPHIAARLFAKPVGELRRRRRRRAAEEPLAVRFVFRHRQLRSQRHMPSSFSSPASFFRHRPRMNPIEPVASPSSLATSSYGRGESSKNSIRIIWRHLAGSRSIASLTI